MCSQQQTLEKLLDWTRRRVMRTERVGYTIRCSWDVLRDDCIVLFGNDVTDLYPQTCRLVRIDQQEQETIILSTSFVLAAHWDRSWYSSKLLSPKQVLVLQQRKPFGDFLIHDQWYPPYTQAEWLERTYTYGYLWCYQEYPEEFFLENAQHRYADNANAFQAACQGYCAGHKGQFEKRATEIFGNRPEELHYVIHHYYHLPYRVIRASKHKKS